MQSSSFTTDTEARVYRAMCALAGNLSTLEANLDEIGIQAQVSERTASQTVTGLLKRGCILRHIGAKNGAHGGRRKTRYTIIGPPPKPSPGTIQVEAGGSKWNPSGIQVESKLKQIPRTEENKSKKYESAAAAGETREKNRVPMEFADPRIGAVRALLAEFGIGNPTRERLAVLIAARWADDTADVLRAIYSHTKADWQAGRVRRLVGMTIKRLEDYAEGLQMSLFDAPPATDQAERVAAERAARVGDGPQSRGHSTDTLDAKIEASLDFLT